MWAVPSLISSETHTKGGLAECQFKYSVRSASCGRFCCKSLEESWRHLAPGSLERLLFDDIPYLAGAQEEHDRFAQVLREQGVHVVYLSQLVAETLAQSQELKESFVRDFTHQSGSIAHRYAPELQEYLCSILDIHEMVLKTMAGIPFAELGLQSSSSLAAMVHGPSDFALEPIPNLYFTRDPFASIGNGVSLHHMYSVTRRRETLYSKYVLRITPTMPVPPSITPPIRPTLWRAAIS